MIINQKGLGSWLDWLGIPTDANSITPEDINSCSQAAGGSFSNQNYLNCIAAKRGTIAAIAQNDPVGAANYASVTEDGVSYIFNPLVNASGNTNWWLIGGIALAALVVIKKL